MCSYPKPHQANKKKFPRLTVMLTFLLTATIFGPVAQAATLAEDFSVKEYDEFHRVLHPLEHEALPKNDMATIRRRAGELIKLGEAIVKLGVPAGTKSEYVENFKKELEKFKSALAKYGTDAESGSDTDLKKSYSAVHDSFEELVGMLPRK
jgi:hypothetical protein